MKPCTVAGCGRVEYLAHGYCDKHYKRWKKTGDTRPPSQPSMSERFWRKVDKTGDCWLWTAALDHRGYGAFNDGTRTRKAQQVSYELTVGPIPDGLVLDHLCRTPACVNPDHLEPVTRSENSRRAARPGYFGNANACKRGHDWSIHPPQVAHRSDGTVSRYCKACAAGRKRARAEDNTGLALASGWLVRIEGGGAA